MNEIDLATLIAKYNQGTATPAEKRFVELYYDALEQRPSFTDSLDPTTEQEIRKAIQKQIQLPSPAKTPRNLVNLFSWVGYVAAAVILLVLSYQYIFVSNSPSSSPPTRASRTQLPTIPDQNRYLQLADGSSVILVGESTLEYVTTFKDSPTREVQLNGEAFFDIQHDAKKPFIVHTGQLTTKVVGTSFSIKNDEYDANIIVRVFTGKVQVNHRQKVVSVLTQNEQLIYDPSLQSRTQSVVHTAETNSWYKEDLYCDDITVVQACTIIESRYNVTISVQDKKLQQKRFTTTFLKEETLDDILHSVAIFNDANVEKIEDSTHSKPYYVLSPL